MSPTRTELPPEASSAPRLTRRMDERVVAGVAAGMARYFALPAWLVRAAFVVLALPLGLGAWAYILAAFAMPPTGVPRPDAPIDRLARWVRAAPGWRWAVLGVAVAIFAVTLARDELQADLVAGVALLIAGAFVLAPRRRQDREVRETPVRADVPATPAGAAPSPPRRRRERSRLGLLTLGIALSAVGFAALLDRTGTIDIAPQQYLALPVLILGAGMLVGARWGRAKWLTLPALLLTPPLLLLSVIDVPFDGGYADRRERPRTVADIRPEYRLAGGKWAIDLRDVPLTGERPVRVSAQVAAGTIEVFVPARVTLDLHVVADWGYVDLLSWSGSDNLDEYGFDLDVRRTFPGRTERVIALDLRIGIGSVRVNRGFPETYGS